jgi:hypothetical protein
VWCLSGYVEGICSFPQISMFCLGSGDMNQNPSKASGGKGADTLRVLSVARTPCPYPVCLVIQPRMFECLVWTVCRPTSVLCPVEDGRASGSVMDHGAPCWVGRLAYYLDFVQLSLLFIFSYSWLSTKRRTYPLHWCISQIIPSTPFFFLLDFGVI